MSGFISKDAGIASSVFIPLWLIIAVLSFWRRSTWLIILCCAFRVMAEAFQIVYALNGEPAYKWQVSYLLMTTQSQCMIIVTMLTLYIGVCDTRMKRPFQTMSFLSHYIVTVVYVVIGDLVYVSSLALSYMDSSFQWTYDYFSGLNELLRGIGQGLLSAVVLVVTIFIAVGWFRDKNNSRILLVLAGCFMIVRCVYGILEPFVMNFLRDTNYHNGSLDNSIVVYDKVLGATMEWLALVTLVWVPIEAWEKRSVADNI